MKYAGREKEYMHEYYLANKKRIRAQNDAWDSEHADEMREWMKKYREEHKEQAAKYAKEYREKNRDKINDRTKRWRNENITERREKQKLYARTKAAEYSGRNSVRQKTRRAVANGILEKKPCENCGNPKAEIHHYDYNKPMLVSWLCKKCHAEWHRNNEAIPLIEESNKKVKAYLELNGKLPDGVESTGYILRKTLKGE